MQNVVEVACSSPPVAMNATKPAAQAVQAADQDPFDLVLQKASEKIVNDRPSDSANRSSDSKSTEVKRGSDSTANGKVAQTKNEREVDRTNKTDKTEKPIKAESSHSDDENVKEDAATDSTSDPATMGFGFVTPPIQSAETQSSDQVAVIDANITSEMAGGTVQPDNLVNTSSETSSEVPETTTSAEQTKTFSTTVTTKEAQNTNVETQTEIVESLEPKVVTQENKTETNDEIPFSDARNNSAKIDGKTVTEQKPVSQELIDKTVTDGKVNVSDSSNNHGDEVNSVAIKNQEVASTAEALESKAAKSMEVETNQQAAPPDNPNGTTAVTESAAVQTTTQISEPARLAEAPKNEVITQVATQIDQLVKTNRSSIRLQLYPAELGHIDLRIVTTKDGISVTMVTEKASTQQFLKSDMDMLKQNIEQAGIQLSNLNINQGNNSNKQQSFEHRQNLSNGSYPGTSSDNSNSTSEEPRVHLTSTVVDYRV